MTGSPLRRINDLQLLYFGKCSSALGHCNNWSWESKSLGIYGMSQFPAIWEKYSRALDSSVLTRVNPSLHLLETHSVPLLLVIIGICPCLHQDLQEIIFFKKKNK